MGRSPPWSIRASYTNSQLESRAEYRTHLFKDIVRGLREANLYPHQVDQDHIDSGQEHRIRDGGRRALRLQLHLVLGRYSHLDMWREEHASGRQHVPHLIAENTQYFLMIVAWYAVRGHHGQSWA